ncbi:MAG: hypothetical protein Kow0042_18370 [Calditrichia bacterium]
MKTISASLRGWLVEIFSIVLGVLLALGLNAWQEHQANQSLAHMALINVANEIRSNMKILNQIHQNNQKVVEQMASHSKDQKEEPARFIPGLQLKSTSWETLISTGVINFVDYKLVLKLSELYSIQEVYQQSGMMLTEAAMNMSAYATVLGKEVDDEMFQNQFEDYLRMMLTIEEEILNHFPQVLSLLGNGDDE